MVGLGSAPMNPASLEFLKIALGCDIVEGYGCLYFTLALMLIIFYSYGSTENCGAGGRANAPDYTSAGTVGPPGISMEWKLVDVPSLGYSSEDKPNPRGEIYTRGDPNFKCYFKGQIMAFIFPKSALTF